MYYLMFDSISISLFIVLSLSFYGYVLVKHRWFVDEGTLEYYNKKIHQMLQEQLNIRKVSTCY